MVTREASHVIPVPTETLNMDLGKSLVIKGELSASEDVILHGQFEGTISLPNHTLSVAPQATINASIEAKAVVIMGAITGSVTARDRIELQATGSMTGDLASPRLVVAEGGCLKGKVEMPAPKAKPAS